MPLKLGKAPLLKLHLDCYLCFQRQALQAARFTGANEEIQRKTLLRIMDILASAPPDATPPQLSEIIHRAIREETGSKDAYREVKQASTRQALGLYPRLKQLVAQAPDPFALSVRLAVTGNMIDFAVADHFDLWEDIQTDLELPLAHDETPRLAHELEKAAWVLYLADNAGETVFDRILLEALQPKPVKYIVKSGPVLNDATREDALAAGIDQLAEIHETGVDAAGVVLQRSSPAFRALLANAPVIIAKGQANYESLGGTPGNIFYLFKVKCPMVSAAAGQPLGSQIVYHD